MAATATYDLRFIQSSAVAIVNTIILQKEPVGKVLARINIAAVCDIEYTGTVSLIVQQIIQILRRTNTPLYLHVKDEVVDRAVSTFLNYWREVLCVPHHDVGGDNSYVSRDTVSPLAVAAYIGDLHTLGYLSPWLLTTCVAYMVNNFGRPFQLRCIEMILERANSYPVPRLEPLYVLECLGTIRQRAHRLFAKGISTEEDSLTHLLYRLLFKTHTTTIHWEREDPRPCQYSIEVINTDPVLNHDHGDKVDDPPSLTPSPAPELVSSPSSSARRSFYKPRTFEELDSIWELCDAIYASPPPEDLPPIDF